MKTLTARTPADLIAAATTVLGFVPENSIVMLTFGGPGFHARVDIGEGAADALLSPCLTHGVDRVVFIVFSTDRNPWELDALADTFTSQGIDVLELLHVNGNVYTVGVEDLAEPQIMCAEDHPFLKEAALRHNAATITREDLAKSILPTPGGFVSDDDADDTRTQGNRMRWLAQHRHSFANDVEVQEMVNSFQNLHLRDMFWSAIDRASAPRIVDLLTDLVARMAPGVERDNPLALLAFAAWQRGDGAMAWTALDAITDRDHGLLTLMDSCLSNAVPPSTFPGMTAEDIDAILEKLA